MNTYKETGNYIWNTEDKLGQGATAQVYKGANKKTGEPVAIKYFFNRKPEPQEIRLLRRINHSNIVKCLGFESTASGETVIIMELCSGDSLLKVLCHPEQSYGLNDKEFLLVLKHLHYGMKYLKENNLIHRDLKPANIMKCVLDDGTHIYKLTDFGTARELDEGEQFQSIHGTEEYLHPNVYERAFLTRRPISFDGTIDLWSLGVTLYHTATGSLPFLCFGGRSNMDKRALHKITTKKKSGDISGIQTAQNGIVTYSKELPDSCLLSASLKKLITPVLAGLMESDLSKTWDFSKFFAEVEAILSRRSAYIFYLNQGRVITLYVSNDTGNLRSSIEEATGIAITNQLLLFKKCLVTDAVGIPVTTPETPIFVYDVTNVDVCIDEMKELPLVETFPAGGLMADLKQCGVALRVNHQYKREIEKFCLYGKLVYDAIDNIADYLHRELDGLYLQAKNLFGRIKFLNSLQLAPIEEDITGFMLGPFEIISLLHRENCEGRFLKASWETFTRNMVISPQSIESKTKTYIDSLAVSFEQFKKDNEQRILSPNTQKFHFLEKIKVLNLSKKFQNVLNYEAYPFYRDILVAFGNWFKGILITYQQVGVFNDEINSVQRKLSDYEQMIVNQRNNKWDGVLSILKTYDRSKNGAELLKENWMCMKDLTESIDRLNN